MGRGTQSIANIDSIIDNLSPYSRELFNRLFSLTITSGKLSPPQSMLPWIEHQFGSVERVTTQKIVKITNLFTFEGAMYNSLRALRPRQLEDRLSIEARIMDRATEDPLANPYLDTPEDIFGRIKGKYSVTASNIAKYESLHGIVIFDDYNPLDFNLEKITDYLSTAWEWGRQAYAYDPQARFFFFLWNSLKKAGATLAHGHAQVVLGRGQHYAKVELLKDAASRYRAQYSSDYFDDLYRVHLDMGLAMESRGNRLFAYLTPIKEKEIIVLSQDFDSSLAESVYTVLACFRDRLFVSAFNVGIAVPPFVDEEKGWENFPVVSRMVDRGYPGDGSSDFAGMELYAASIITSDPFICMQQLKQTLPEGGG